MDTRYQDGDNIFVVRALFSNFLFCLQYSMFCHIKMNTSMFITYFAEKQVNKEVVGTRQWAVINYFLLSH